MGSKEGHIYHVSFKKPKDDGKTDFYFTSLAAIYEQFNREDIGCKAEWLWQLGISNGNRYESRHCTITREAVYRKSQNKSQTTKMETKMEAFLFEKLAGQFRLHGLRVVETIKGDIADLVIFDFAAGNIKGRTAAVVYHNRRKAIFVLHDWHGSYPETLDEIKDYDWLDESEATAIMFEGLPRLSFLINR